MAFLALSAFALAAAQGALALSIALPPRRLPGSGVETFYSASDPLVWSVGRFQANADGSKSFDWESSQLHINVANATYVRLVANASGSAVGRIVVDNDGWESTSFWLSAGSGTEFLVSNENQLHHIRVTSVLEPAFEDVSPDSFFTYIGFKTDGVAVAPTPRARRLELVGCVRSHATALPLPPPLSLTRPSLNAAAQGLHQRWLRRARL